MTRRAATRRVWMLACVALSAAWSIPIARASPNPEEEAALRIVREFSAAYMKLDVEGVARLTHPVLVLRAGGEPQYRENLAKFFANLKPLKLDEGEERLGTPSELYVNGRARMIGVPAIRKSSVLESDWDVYVAVSIANRAPQMPLLFRQAS